MRELVFFLPLGFVMFRYVWRFYRNIFLKFLTSLSPLFIVESYLGEITIGQTFFYK